MQSLRWKHVSGRRTSRKRFPGWDRVPLGDQTRQERSGVLVKGRGERLEVRGEGLGAIFRMLKKE